MSRQYKIFLSFAQKPRLSATSRAEIVQIDHTISQARVRDLETGCESIVAVAQEDCSEQLRDVVTLGKGVLRVECDIDVSRIQQIHLAVDEAAFDEAVTNGLLSRQRRPSSIWREVYGERPKVPTQLPEHDTGDVVMEQDGGILQSPIPWNSKYPLHEHQIRSVNWMGLHESTLPREIAYAGNLRITETWYLDTEGECLTTDASWREAQVSGGILADGTGKGKTATVLSLVSSLRPLTRLQTTTSTGCKYSSDTLLILPINLVAQWRDEISKFVGEGFRVVFLVHGNDVRNATMQTLLDAHMVITTFHFLRSSKPYLEMVETALRSRARSRASLISWARMENRSEPLLEAVYWRRIVVDEIHTTFESPETCATCVSSTRLRCGV